MFDVEKEMVALCQFSHDESEVRLSSIKVAGASQYFIISAN